MPAPNHLTTAALLYAGRLVTIGAREFRAFNVDTSGGVRSEKVIGPDNQVEAKGQWNDLRTFSATFSGRVGVDAPERNETFTYGGVEYGITSVKESSATDSHTKWSIEAEEMPAAAE
jgi:hypothetical protein